MNLLWTSSGFNRKLNCYRYFAVLAIFLLFPVLTNADTIPDRKNNKLLYTFLPDYYKLQYAGGIGFLSAGVGYGFFNERIDISYFYGYVPDWVSKNDLHSVSLQLTGKPFRLNLNNKTEYYPLNIGIFLHHTFGNEYYITLPDYYPEDYYWWYPGRTGGLFLEGQYNYQFRDSDKVFSQIGFYYRIVTRGVYLTSKISNTSIPLEDIFSLGLGIIIYK
ncbi:MAG TPA: hypothetical protein P5132_06255 [Bacteroidales bacterium]|mgnify:CR=1 FL=1|nr:hypothetical protein [Bacteroidales bacterium]